MGTNYNPCVATDGLILYLDAFNSSSYAGTGTTWYDISGNSNHATLVSSPTYTVSNGGTFVLDGSSNYFTLPNNSILSVSNFTISIWVKLAQLNADQYLIDTSSNLNFGYGYSFRIRSNNTIRFWAYDANNSLDTTDTVSSNTWYHITVSYNNTSKTQKIYINGSLSVSGQHTNSFVAATVSYLRIGVSQVLGGYTKGVIAQTQFYNRELAAADIQQNYYATKKRYSPEENIVRDGLVFHYDAGKTSSYSGIGVTIFDLSGIGNTGTLINGPTFSSLNGGSIVFDGTTNYIDLTPSGTGISLTSSSDFNVSGWIYVEATQPKIAPSVVEKYNGVGGYPLAIRWASNTLYTIVYDGTNSAAAGASITPNTWAYFSANNILSQKKLEMYMNSSLIGSTTYSTLNNITTTASIKIGYRGFDSNTYFAGKLAKLQIYNRALSATEIQQNYNATKGRFGL